MMNFFEGRKLHIATKHGKEAVIAPLFKNEFLLDVSEQKPFDTDQFGTFTREVKRVDDQKNTLRQKALVYMDLFDADMVVASEGSFGLHPSVPFVSSNYELLLFLDRKHNLEVFGSALSVNTVSEGRYVHGIQELEQFAKQLGFPDQGLILRFHQRWGRGLYKELHDWKLFLEQAERMFSMPFVKRIFVETDMRAHRNPTRMKVIEQATHDLLKNLKTQCPNCSMPGFSQAQFCGQKKCESCLKKTETSKWKVISCSYCSYQNVSLVGELHYELPDKCSFCNP